MERLALSVLGSSPGRRVMGFGKDCISAALASSGLVAYQVSHSLSRRLRRRFPQGEHLPVAAERTAVGKGTNPMIPLGFFNHSPGTAGILVHGSSPCPCAPLFQMSFLSFDGGERVLFRSRRHTPFWGPCPWPPPARLLEPVVPWAASRALTVLPSCCTCTGTVGRVAGRKATPLFHVCPHRQGRAHCLAHTKQSLNS